MFMLMDFFVWFYLFVWLWGTYPDASALSCFDLWFRYFLQIFPLLLPLSLFSIKLDSSFTDCLTLSHGPQTRNSVLFSFWVLFVLQSGYLELDVCLKFMQSTKILIPMSSTASLVQTWGTSSRSPHRSIQFPLCPRIPEPSCCHINLFSFPKLFNNLMRICSTLTLCQVLCFKLGLW